MRYIIKKKFRIPALQEMIRETAKLGGFLGRNRDGEPGVQTLWRGLIRLKDMAKIYSLMIGFNLPIN